MDTKVVVLALFLNLANVVRGSGERLDSTVSTCSLQGNMATITQTSPSFISCAVINSGLFLDTSGLPVAQCVSNSSFRVFLHPLVSTLTINCRSPSVIAAQFEFVDKVTSPMPLVARLHSNQIHSYLVDMLKYKVTTRYKFTAALDSAEVSHEPISIFVVFRPNTTAGTGDGIVLYGSNPGNTFQATEDSVLVPCLTELSTPPLVYQVQYLLDTCSFSRVGNSVISYDPVNGIHLNVSKLAYTAFSYLCCSGEPRENDCALSSCVQFNITDPPDVVVTPPTQLEQSIQLLASKGDLIPLPLECSAWFAVELRGTRTTAVTESASQQGLGSVNVTGTVRQTRFHPRQRFLAYYETSVQTQDRLRMECVNSATGQVLNRWNITVDGVDGEAHLKFGLVQRLSEGAKPVLRCISKLYKDTRLRLWPCNNEIDCRFLKHCAGSENCDLPVSIGTNCSGNGNHSMSCQQIEAANGLFTCTAGNLSFSEVRWLGLSNMTSYAYDSEAYRDPLVKSEIITLKLQSDPTGEAQSSREDPFYTRIPYRLSCTTHPFWSDGNIEMLFGFSNRPSNYTEKVNATNLFNPIPRTPEIGMVFHSSFINRVICRAPKFGAAGTWITAESRYLNVIESTPADIQNLETAIAFDDDSQTKVLECRAGGQPPPSVTWSTFVNGANVQITTDPSQPVYVTGKSSLIFPKFSEDLEGIYKCTATNRFGTESMNFAVSLVGAGNAADSGSHVGTYAGAVVAGVLGILAIVLGNLYYFLFRKRRVLDQVEVKRFRYGDANELWEESAEIEDFTMCVDSLANDDSAQPSGANAAQPPPTCTLLRDAYAKPFDVRFEIRRKMFKMDKSRQLGAGEFGKVYEGSLRQDDGDGKTQSVKVAIKVPQRNCPEVILIGLLKEVKIMTYLEHENVVSLIGAHTTGVEYGHLYIIMEFCAGGSLDQCFRNWDYSEPKPKAQKLSRPEASAYIDWPAPNRPTISFPDLLRWAKEVATGMEFLASKGVVHRDLAARNILLTVSRLAKISDFGLSRQLYGHPTYEQQSTELKLPARWMAPECFTGTFSTQSDVWSYGILVWEIFSLGQLPYAEIEFSDPAHFADLLRRGLRIVERHRTTPEIFGKLNECWSAEPLTRPSFTDMKKFFSRLVDGNLTH